ncbi:4-(cytidine 5'-diphospho)-2-C-methyl-D-erythritol kinase [Candidatus Epulonipiscium fishelsonii]|uniref:4-(Cytidine 5'-diphospho)-2-C-methyl-D-erythritol kinase n=1 Tax=Candidatus Epulonipiscium fishelsonii TaxID=77094 RepID=A0ACC8XCX1_9FIRM|nr:4-(cytidine 5'-diphospho)-2-C-methyl-D-erythritol kinase [Epulopiscium sp. SCG-B05WGA-EpuloA1]ONI40806.1 4-(cytidine 5'-diphospho)-2-C-methyl-D-erythritol kinase [Epulopiscium sp. SCG-B11WGA-EpuloA1]
METITLRAKAKINISLDVIGKRENGYHDLRMIMQTINLYDTIYIKKTKSPKIQINTNIPWLPIDDKNIAYQAVQVFLEEANLKYGVYIDIFKRIPISAGLAGGSTDAAAVLVGLNKIFRTGFSKRKLMEIGVKLGADVPFCILRGTVLAEGIGEVLTPLPSIPYTYILLAKPNISVSTATVYQALCISSIKVHPKTDELINAIKCKDIKFIFSNMENVLQEVTIAMYPEIEKIKKEMLNQGAIASMMSGSGPTVFGVYKNNNDVIKAANYFKEIYGLKEVYVTSTYYPEAIRARA